MENRNIILHISDLHIGFKNENNCNLMDPSYIKKMIDAIEAMKININAIIISGDIVDKGIESIKYNTANDIINDICQKLDVDKKNLLIVPGNHDVNLNERGDDVASYLNYRYKSFVDFTSKNGRIIDIQEPVVFCEKWDNEKVIFIGVNSNKVVDSSISNPQQLNKGKINDVKLDSQIKQCLEGYEDWTKILIMHHWPSSYKGELASTLEVDNIPVVERILEMNKIDLVLCGHVHGSTSMVYTCLRQEEDHFVNYCCVGSVGCNFGVDAENTTNRHNSFNIIDLEQKKISQYKFFKDENEERWISWEDIPIKKVNKEQFVLEKNANEEVNIEDISLKEKILDIIKKNQLYKSGHFHGSGKPRLGWIDTQYLLTNRECRELVVDSINKKIQEIVDEEKETCIIGLGLKGNLITSYIRYYWGECKFDYFPDNNISHIDCEKYIDINNTYKKVIVVTDAVYSGTTVTNCINVIKKKVSDACDIEVICLLYVQKEERIDKFDITSSDGDYSIHINCLCSVGVPVCPMPSPLMCSIFNDNLEVIYKIN